MPNHRPRFLSCGLSLVELLVTLVIFSCIGAFSTGAIESMRRLGSFRDTTEGLVNALREGRSRAVESGREHEVLVSEIGWRLSSGVREGEPSTVRVRSFPSGVSGPQGENNAIRIRFFTSGVVTPTTIHLTNGHRRSRITVSLRGRVTVSIE